MANSGSQDGSVEPRTPKTKFTSPGSSDVSEDVEVRANRFKITRLASATDVRNGGSDVSEDLRNHRLRLPRLASTNDMRGGMNRSGANNVPGGTGMTRSVSSNDFNRPKPSLQRTVSSVGALKAEILKNNIGSKNGNMVLKLVLPSNNIGENGNYLTNTSIDEILGEPNSRRRSFSSQADVYSTAGTECYVNQAFTNDLDQYVRNLAQSPVSMASSSDNAKGSSVEEKKKSFWKHLTRILSSVYAIFLVTLGLVVFITDVLVAQSSLAENFCLYLVTVSLIFVLYLTVDIKLYVNRRNRYNDLLQKNVAEEIEMKESPSGDYQLNIKLPEAIKLGKDLEHHYCFSRDKHSSNFYLKVGAAVFCVGHLIHSGLLVGYQILFLSSEAEDFYECATIASLVLDILYPVYSFLLLYFIFKYSNIIINRHVPVVRFGLMHCLASSLCFWLWTIFRETVESLANHAHEIEVSTNSPSSSLSEIAFFTGQPVALPLTSYSQKGASLLRSYLNVSVRQFLGECHNDAAMSEIYRNYSPYLYPFSVEYSILVVGVLFVIWDSIGKCKEKEEVSLTRPCDSPEGSDDNQESNIVIHADCHSANKGLFGGIVIMVLTVVSVILFLIAVNDDRYEGEAVIINTSTAMVITTCMLLASLFAYHQISKLDVSHHHMSILDDLLLYICIPAYFLNGIVVLIPAIENGNPEGITLNIIELIQVIIQTPLIMDGLRRCSNTKELRKKKPGRELLTFLIVCNVAMWIMQTFEVKSHDLEDHRNEFYGQELWAIIGHACVPLMMFYRFHASVCLTDVWKYAYESDSH